MQKDNLTIKLDHGAGGLASWELLKKVRGILKFKGEWTVIVIDNYPNSPITIGQHYYISNI